MFKEIMSYLQNAELDTKIRDINKQFKDASFFKPLLAYMKEDGVRAGEKISFAETGKFKITCILYAFPCAEYCIRKSIKVLFMNIQIQPLYHIQAAAHFGISC